MPKRKRRGKGAARKVLKLENKIESEEQAIEKEEKRLLREERKIMSEEEQIELLEKEILSRVDEHTLDRISWRDINRGIIGAFFGIVAHFAFVYGTEIAHNISMFRATTIYFVSYAILFLLLYKSGFRNVKKRELFGILPLRASVIYLTSLMVIVVVFFLFNQVDFSNLVEVYKAVSVTSVLAVIGAGTADLIGR